MSGSTTYKIFRTADTFLGKTATIAPNNGLPMPSPVAPKKQNVEALKLNIVCPKCKKPYQITGYFNTESKKIKELGLPTNPNITDNDILICDNCKFELDLKPIKNELETIP